MLNYTRIITINKEIILILFLQQISCKVNTQQSKVIVFNIFKSKLFIIKLYFYSYSYNFTGKAIGKLFVKHLQTTGLSTKAVRTQSCTDIPLFSHCEQCISSSGSPFLFESGPFKQMPHSASGRFGGCEQDVKVTVEFYTCAFIVTFLLKK